MSKLMKSAFLAMLLIFSGCSIDGTITDENGDPIINAVIVATYAEETQQVLSDGNGDYSISNVDSGTEVSILVNKEGYISQSKSTTATDGTVNLDFILQASGDEIPLEIKSISGRFLNSKGEAREGYVTVTNGFGFKSVEKNEEGFTDGNFTIRPYTGKQVLFASAQTVTLKFAFSESNKNTLFLEKTYAVKDYLDKNDSSHMIIGDISIEEGIVKGCAKNILGLDFGMFTYSYPEDSISGISYDNRFSIKPKYIYDEDDGKFEFTILKDDKIHTLTIRDPAGRTDTITFLADKNEIDLTDSCIQVKSKVNKNIPIKINVDSNISIGDVRIISLDNDDINEKGIEYNDGEFILKESGQYWMILTAKEPVANPNQGFLSYNNQILDLTFFANNKELKAETSFTVPDENDHLTYTIRFALYQGDIVVPSQNK